MELDFTPIRASKSVLPRPTTLLVLCLVLSGALRAEVCTTQSQMKPADRDAIAAAARTLAGVVEAGDVAALRQQSVPEIAKDSSAMNSLIANTAAKIKGDPLAVDQVYLLDATNLKTLADGANQDAQFFCSLNKSMAEANFLIPSLPPGRYAFANVVARGPANPPSNPWSLSFLLRQDASGSWLLAGFYPKALTAAGHDGLWYWTQAREMVKAKQLWTAYLYYQEAESLLQPAGFVTSSHLDKLRKEATANAPPALSDGIGTDAPLVIKGAKNAEYRFTALTTDDSLGGDKLYVLVHLAPDAAADPAPSGGGKEAKPAKDAAASAAPLSPRDRNSDAMAALITAYPELRANFKGVWVFADSPGHSPFVTEQAMADIH